MLMPPSYTGFTYSIVKERLRDEVSLNRRVTVGGDNRARTGALSLAKAALSQLSYIPT